MSFLQVGLRFDEVFLERCPVLFRLRLGFPGSAVFLEFPHFSNEAVGGADDLPYCDWFARCGCIIHTIVQPRVEALKGLVGIVGFPELIFVLGQVRCQYTCVVHVQVAQEGQSGGSGLAGE